MKEKTMRRLEQMLEHDKEKMNEPSRLAAQADFLHVAGEYFEVEGTPQFSVECIKGVYEVRFSCRARRVKNFSVIK